MKLRIEIGPGMPEEVVIRAPEMTDDIKRVQEVLGRTFAGTGEIAVKNGGEECYLPYRELLFFETSDNRVWAHTAKNCFVCPLRLNELEILLPRSFARASKSCLINTAHIRSISRSPTGVSEATFASSEKTVYISRMYYKNVRDMIEETRLR